VQDAVRDQELDGVAAIVLGSDAEGQVWAIARDVLQHSGRVLVRVVRLTDDGRAEVHEIEGTEAVAEIGRRRLRAVHAAASAGSYPARPGASCGRYGGCPYVSDCVPARSWLAGAVPMIGEDDAPAALAALRADLSAREDAVTSFEKALRAKTDTVLAMEQKYMDKIEQLRKVVA